MSSGSQCPSVSAVVVTHNEGANLPRTVHRLLATTPCDAEVVVVDDHSSDGSPEGLAGTFPGVRVVRPPTRLGASAARNFGARHSTGSVLLFSDAHVEPPLGWFDAFVPLLSRRDTGAVGPAVSIMGRESVRGYGLTWTDAALTARWLPARSPEPYAVPLLGGFFLGMRRDVFEATGGFDDGLVEWGGVDVELSIRLWTLGYRCLLVPGVTVAHLFRERFPYSLAPDAPLHNKLRIAGVHLTASRVTQVVERLRSWRAFPAAVARLVESDCLRRREEVRARRCHNDDWFFEKFAIQAFEHA